MQKMNPDSKFLRHENANLTTELICTGCFRTIAVSHHEHDLVAAEESHQCDTVENYFQRYVESQIGTF